MFENPESKTNYIYNYVNAFICLEMALLVEYGARIRCEFKSLAVIIVVKL